MSEQTESNWIQAVLAAAAKRVARWPKKRQRELAAIDYEDLKNKEAHKVSELTKELDRLSMHGLQPDEYYANQDELAVHLADHLRSLVDAHDAETAREAETRLAALHSDAMDKEIERAVAKAKREQMEADCRVVCFLCSGGTPVFFTGTKFLHGDRDAIWSKPECEAWRIRAAWAKTHQEENDV